MGSTDWVTQAPGLQPHIFWLAFKVAVQGVGCVLESDKETGCVCRPFVMIAVVYKEVISV